MSVQHPVTLSGNAHDELGKLPLYQSYKKSPYLSIKHSSYFHVYVELFEKYRGQPVTFVEIGVLNGGSLFMWRDYLGANARIIGVDFNPLAKRWEKDGFEIHVGSQSDPSFWDAFFKSTGPVDVVLDDGGHTYEQQIVTVHHCVPNIRDGGLMVIEDTHTSYFREFGYPTRYSFIEWTKKLIDNINSRFPAVKASALPYKESVYSIAFFESIVSMRIDRRKCIESKLTSNDGTSLNAEDFRHKDTVIGATQGVFRRLARKYPFLKDVAMLQTLKNKFIDVCAAWHARMRSRRLGRFFR